MILVLVLLAFLASIAIPRVMNAGVAAEASIHDRLRIHLRYAQAQAMGDGTHWGIRLRSGEYWLFRGANPNTEVRITGEVELRIAAPGITDFDVSFDRWGRPFASATIPQGLPSSAVNIQVGANTISILADTGFIR